MTNIPDFGKKKDKHKPDSQYNPNEVYENLNKLPLIVGDYRHSMMDTLKKTFIDQLDKAAAEEKKACAKRHMDPIMAGKTHDDVCDLVVRCRTIFEIEALARFVFDDNEIPTYVQLKRRAMLLDNAFPVRLKQ
jgi:hypothetical protein